MPATAVEITPPATEATPVAPANVTQTNDGGSTTKVQASQPATPPAPDPKAAERPAWLPEKFKTVEDFAASYKELESKVGKPAETPAPATDEAAQKAIADAGIDMAALTKEYAENKGVLSQATLDSLKAKGVPPETVASYVKGQEARAEVYTGKLAATVGGPENMKAIFEWAALNVSKAEIEAFNATMMSFNEPMAALALQGLSARYTQAVGSQPRLVTGSPVAGDSGVKPFASNAEVIAAMSDKRYKNGDAAYHAEVERRMAATTSFRSRA